MKLDSRKGPWDPLLIAGPTGVGKSAAAQVVADRLGGEIVSVDAMQVYRGLDIGTAKPGPAERARVPHHLLDVVSLAEEFNVAQFTRLATRAIREIQQLNRLPILCGGTGLYFKGLLEGLGTAPPAHKPLRAELARLPLNTLLRELEARDPETFRRIDRRNPRRVIRALEIIRATGCPASDLRGSWSPGGGCRPPAVGLTRARASLHLRIEERVDAMFREGLIDETRGLLDRGLAANPTAMQAIGYRQVVEYLRGTRSLADTVARVKTRTRQLAKRQMTWFRRQMRLHWIHWEPDWSPERVADEIIRFYQSQIRAAADCDCADSGEALPSSPRPERNR